MQVYRRKCYNAEYYFGKWTKPYTKRTNERNRTRSVPTLNSQKEPHIDEINVNSQRERNVERIRQIGLKAMRSEEMGAKIDGIAR